MKGIGIPAVLIVAALILAVLFFLFEAHTLLHKTYTGTITAKDIEIITIKNVFYLTEISLRGALKAIASEAVFHPFDTGLSSSGDVKADIVNWVEETETTRGKFRGQPAWTTGRLNYPNYTKEQFKDYIDWSIPNFLTDNLATDPINSEAEFTIGITKGHIDYDFSDVGFNKTIKIAIIKTSPDILNSINDLSADRDLIILDGNLLYDETQKVRFACNNDYYNCEIVSDNDISNKIKRMQAAGTNIFAGIVAEEEVLNYDGTDYLITYNTTPIINEEGMISIRKSLNEILVEPSNPEVMNIAKQRASKTSKIYEIKNKNNRIFKAFPIINSDAGCSEETEIAAYMKQTNTDADILKRLIESEMSQTASRKLINSTLASISFNVNATVGMTAGESEIKPRLWKYYFDFPVSLNSTYNIYNVSKKITKGFEPGEISGFSDSELDFIALMNKTVGNEHDTGKEDAIKNKIKEMLSDYEDEIKKSKNLDVKFYYDPYYDTILYNLTLDATYQSDEPGKADYKAYLINYTFLVNVTNASAEKFCCNWHPETNISGVEAITLRFILNDTFLALDCDDNHKTVVWKEHRDDGNHLVCVNDENKCHHDEGDDILWVNSSEFSAGLYDLDAEGNYESYWNSSEDQWYRCGYTFGDDIGYKWPWVLSFDGLYDTANCGGTSDSGEILCDHINKNWLKCLKDKQDFRIFRNAYCCIDSAYPSYDTGEICKWDEQKDDEYCCVCFDHSWVGSSRHDPNGYCIGDGVCEHDVGESVYDSPNDCCDYGSFACTAKYDKKCYKECAGINGCPEETESIHIIDGNLRCSADNKHVLKCWEEDGVRASQDCGESGHPDPYSYDECKTGCEKWHVTRSCSNAECIVTYTNSKECNPYTCSAGSCTATCSKACGAECETAGDCTNPPHGSCDEMSCNANCECVYELKCDGTTCGVGSGDYCQYCNHCGDGSCNCGETAESCSDDC